MGELLQSQIEAGPTERERENVHRAEEERKEEKVWECVCNPGTMRSRCSFHVLLRLPCSSSVITFVSCPDFEWSAQLISSTDNQLLKVDACIGGGRVGITSIRT